MEIKTLHLYEYSFFLLKGRQRQVVYLPIYSTNTYNSWSWTWTLLQAKNSIQASHVGSIDSTA